MDITIKESINNIKDTIKKSSFAKFNIVEQLPSTNNLYDTYIIEKDEKTYKMNLFRFGESVNLDIFKELNNIKNVNHLVESGQEGDRHYLLWEVLDYPNLGEVEVPIDEFLRKISTTLSNLHKKKIYHLNLNLENIKVKSTKPLEIIIDDFASASITDAEASKKLTNVKGTDLFQSPELSLGIASSKSDYWSLGVILYYLLTKTLPEKNTYTKEILLDNIPFKYENLVKGLLSIDLNKRYGKEEIDIVLGGGKVEVDIETFHKSFTYEGSTFNSLEDFALFLHDEKNGLDIFKKLLYRGYFDKYYGENLLSKLKSSLGELNAFFYRYGQFAQKPFFEGINIYNHFLWFSSVELENINYKDISTQLFSEVYDSFKINKDISKFHEDFVSVRNLINFDLISPSQRALDKIKSMSLTHINSRTVGSGKDRKIEYAVNYLYLQNLVKEDKKLEFLRLALPFEEISKIPREELAAYIQYKYIYKDFKVEGFSERIQLRKLLPDYLYELKYYYRFRNNNEITLPIDKTNLYSSIKKIKDKMLASEYYIKYSNDNELIKIVIELEKNPDYFSYFSFIINNHTDININSNNLKDIDKSILIISHITDSTNTFNNLKASLTLKSLENIYINVDNKEFIKTYLLKIFKKLEVDEINTFDYELNDSKEETFKNFCFRFEVFSSTNQLKRENEYFTLSNRLDKNLIIDSFGNIFEIAFILLIAFVFIISFIL